MALPDVVRIQNTGSEITFKSSAGTAAISMASVANAAARQSVKCDFGASRARRYLLIAEVELAATPTAGNAIEFYAGFSNSGSAATDNPGNLSGSGGAYSGYSSNLTASIKQLAYLGDLVCTTQATATVQRGIVGLVEIATRYVCLAVVNNSGAAFHSSDSNVSFRFIPVEDILEES